MKSVASRRVRLATGATVLLVLALLAWYGRAGFRSERFYIWARQQAYAIQPADIPASEAVFGIQIVGSNDFRLQVARSLHLLKLCDLEAFMTVTNAVGIVREGSPGSASYTNQPPLVNMHWKEAFYSLSWCAGALVHEAHHIVLARRRGDANPLGFTPGRYRARHYKDHQREELECMKLQLHALRRMGASRNEIDHLESQDGTHFAVNQDGKWDWEDERLRQQRYENF